MGFGTALDLGGGAGLLEAGAPATQMLCWQTCPQEQSESVMQPTLVTEAGGGGGGGAPPAITGAATARTSRAALKIISTALMVDLFSLT